MSNTTGKWRLWHPSNGILFNAGGVPVPVQQPLYPRLDMARFAHAASGGPSDAESAVPISAQNRVDAVEPGRKSAPPAFGASKPAEAITLEKAKTTPAVVQQQDGKEAEKVAQVEDETDDPPVTTLSYRMDEDAFRAARLAPPGSPESFWSYTMYRGPGDDGAKVKVHYCKSNHTMERVCRQYFAKEKVLGFDLEWMPDATKAQGPRRNVCLAQLASESRVALFHLSLFPKKDELVSPTFKQIMEDPDITKTGVWIKGDCTRLRNFLGIQSRGIFELSHLYKLVKYSKTGETQLVNRKLVTLAKQVQDHLHLPMFKGADVRSSDWSQQLRLDQIICASPCCP